MSKVDESHDEFDATLSGIITRSLRFYQSAAVELGSIELVEVRGTSSKFFARAELIYESIDMRTVLRQMGARLECTPMRSRPFRAKGR